MLYSTDKELFNTEAEQGLLGAILLDNDRFWDAHGTVSPEDFHVPVHGQIFAKVAEMLIDGRSATPEILKLAFDGNPALIDVGGAEYLRDLARNVISLSNTADYARVISDLSERRRLISGLDELRRLVLNDDRPAAELLSDVTSRLSDSQKPTDLIKTKREVALEAVKSIELPPECYATGLPPLDAVMGGGFYAGFTYGFAGAEKRGKTTLAHTISHNLNESGVRHAYIALEMGAKQIEMRNLARMAGINSLRFLQPNTRRDNELIGSVTQLAKGVKDNTLYLDMPGGTLGQIQIELARLVMKHGIKGFVLDYWQLVEGQQRGETEERHLRTVAQWLANFARKHKIWAVILSQVNEEGKLFAGKGLVKACDQLFTIELSDCPSEDQEIWLKMTHSRYTALKDVGSVVNPLLFVNRRRGPYVDFHSQEPENV